MTKTEYKLFKLNQYADLYYHDSMYNIRYSITFACSAKPDDGFYVVTACPHNGSYESIMTAMQICRLELIGKQMEAW